MSHGAKRQSCNAIETALAGIAIRCLLSLLYREKRETVWSGTGTTVYAWKPRASGKPAEEKKKTRKNPHRKLHEKNRMKRSEITMEENGADGGAQNWEPKWQRLKYLFRFPETEDRKFGMFLTCQASGPTNQHRKYIRTEYQFHCHTGPSVRAAMQSRPRWPASLIRCLLSLV